MNRLLEYLPDIYHEVIDFVELTDTGAQEVISAEQAISTLFADQYVTEASEQAIKRREKMLGIQADPTTETLDFRRKRLINRYSTKPPFTVRYLQQRLDFLVGAGLTIVSVDPQAFILTVTTNIDNAALFKEVERTVKVTKPANMLYQQQTSLQDTIELRERIKARSVSWNYKLDGSWKLGEKPFADLGMEVVYK
ncbi:putative phage tail protein [Paenibacillus apis]|uniref:Phage portal protein n=1 Tax=Paenibacillus apis TaxID=1792174 RepID=A0A920CMU5_9BACL|nr:putative phage tail protein [Paenibacillus apis]GIO42462.1 phage portal protein [Paenibacillus apis]